MEAVATNFGINEALHQLGVNAINEGTSTGSNNFSNGPLIESFSPVDGALIASVKSTTKEDYEKAIDILEDLYTNKTSIDLTVAARLLHLICIYDVDNMALMDYFIRSTYRFLKKEIASDSFGMQFISFFKRLIKVVDKKDRLELLKTIRSEWKYYDQVIETWHPYLPYSFDYLAWIESKINNSSFVESLEERSTRKND